MGWAGLLILQGRLTDVCSNSLHSAVLLLLPKVEHCLGAPVRDWVQPRGQQGQRHSPFHHRGPALLPGLWLLLYAWERAEQMSLTQSHAGRFWGVNPWLQLGTDSSFLFTFSSILKKKNCLFFLLLLDPVSQTPKHTPTPPPKTSQLTELSQGRAGDWGQLGN